MKNINNINLVSAKNKELLMTTISFKTPKTVSIFNNIIFIGEKKYDASLFRGLLNKN